MTTYRGTPPSLQLYEDDLQGLLDVMMEHTSNPSVEIEVEENGFTHNYQDVRELLDDAALPTHILDYDITVRGDEGRLYISYNSNRLSGYSSYRISGDDGWVRTKKSDLEQYFNNNGDGIRTLLKKDRWKAVISILVAGFISLIVAFLDDQSTAFYTFIAAFNVFWIASSWGYNRLYPYSLIYRKDEPYKSYPKQIVKALITLIGVIGAAITIYNSLAA